MNLPTFYRGFLYALREHVGDDPRFDAESDRFHEAFLMTIEYAAREVPGIGIPTTQILDDFDPVFGVSPQATEMILEGERDFILSLLNPQLRVAQFKITREVAKRELEQLPAHEDLRRLAAKFHERLEATK